MKKEYRFLTNNWIELGEMLSKLYFFYLQYEFTYLFSQLSLIYCFRNLFKRKQYRNIILKIN